MLLAPWMAETKFIVHPGAGDLEDDRSPPKAGSFSYPLRFPEDEPHEAVSTVVGTVLDMPSGS